MSAQSTPRRRFTFTVEGHAHSLADLADALRDAGWAIEHEHVMRSVSSRGYSFRIEDHGGPTEDEFNEQLKAWSASRREESA